MARHFLLNWPRRLRKLGPEILASCWIFGLVVGFFVFLNSGPSFYAQMPGFPMKAMSITGLIVITAFPFLLSISAIYLGMSLSIFLLCFGKAFLYSFSSLCLFSGFGFAGGPLVFLFSHCVGGALLYFLWLRILRGSSNVLWEAWFLMALSIFLGSVEYCVISPYLVSLIYY